MFDKYRIGYLAIVALVTVEAGIAAFVGWRFWGLPPGDVFAVGDMRLRIAGWLLIPLLWLGAAALQMALRRVERPTKVLFRLVSLNKAWLVRGILLAAMVIPLARAFGTLKTSIPLIVPFYADDLYINVDKAIFGIDPWRITHQFIGYTGTIIIDRLYLLWFTVVIILTSWFSFSKSPAFQLRASLAFNLCWFLLGGVMAIALSSVGPCFYQNYTGDPYFSKLMENLKVINDEHGLTSTRVMNFLLTSVGSTKFGSGISAMPSMHVSMAFLLFIATFSLKRNMLWLKIISGFYALIILIGSVHLGWHYAVDGIVSIFGTWLIWVGCGRFVNWVERRADARARIAPGQGAHAPA